MFWVGWIHMLIQRGVVLRTGDQKVAGSDPAAVRMMALLRARSRPLTPQLQGAARSLTLCCDPHSRSRLYFYLCVSCEARSIR